MGREDNNSEKLVESFSQRRANYFSQLLLRFRNEFRILVDLGSAGHKAKKEGWFVGHHSLVEAAGMLKLSEWLGLDNNQRKLLVQSAILHDSNKRLEIESKKSGMEAFTSSHSEANALLEEKGINKEVVNIIEGSSPGFPQKFIRGELEEVSDEEKKLRFLQNNVFYGQFHAN